MDFTEDPDHQLIREAVRLAYPQAELLAREILINLQPQDALIEGAST